MNGSELKQKFDEAVEYANAESFKLHFDDSNGRIFPNGFMNCKPTDEISLSFTPDTDYCFIQWTIIDETTGEYLSDEELNKVAEFKDIKNLNTEVKILKHCPNLKISPKCADRPKVISASPNYDSGGVYRDRKIIIMFDKTMDNSSIYWTAKELEALGVDTENAVQADKDKKDSEGNQYYYSYTNSKNEIVFKNIKIFNLLDENENLLNHYGCPFFDDSNFRVLKIPSKNDNPPPSATDIVVSLAGNICAFDDNFDAHVGIGSKYVFSYRTNANSDIDAPIFGSSFGSFDLKYGDKTFTNYNQFNNNANTLEITEGSMIPQNNFVGKKVWFNGMVTDGESGPKSLEWKIEKENNKFYPKTKDINKSSYLKLKNLTDTKGDFDEGLDIDSLNLEEGAYKLSIIATDNNENEKINTYHFVYDKTPPANSNSIGSIKIEYGMGEVKCTWNSTSIPDVKSVYVAPGPTGTSERNPTELSKDTTTHTWRNFYRHGKQYTFDIYYEDWAGNKSESVYTLTSHYIKSNGNIVINNEEIPYTNMIDINYTNPIPNNGWNGNVNWGFFRNNRGKQFKLSPYALGQYEATNKLWKASRAVTTFYGQYKSDWMPSSNENSENTDNFPVSKFNWFHAVQFCNNLSRLMGFEPVYSVILNNHNTYYDFVEAEKVDWIPENDSWNNFENYNRYLFTDLTKDGYRMPTGAEWEFAARGADPTNSANWNHGYGRSGYSHGDLMWGEWNSGNHNRAVGTKKANAAGFYDMSGNVAEWCNDRLRDGSDYVSTNADSRQNDSTYIINPMNNYDPVRIPYIYPEAYLGTKWERLTIGGDRGSHSDNGRVITNTAGKKAQEKFAYVGIRLCRTIK